MGEPLTDMIIYPPPPVYPLVTLKERDGIAVILMIAAITAMTASSVTDNESNKAAYYTFADTTGSRDDIPAPPSFDGSFSLSSQTEFPQGLAFSGNGMKMFIVDDESDDINGYALSTAFDVSTADFFGNSVVKFQDKSPTDVAFSDDGMKMFVLGDNGNAVYQYALFSSFGLAPFKEFVDSFSVGSQDTSPQGLAFSGNGMKMFVVGTQNNAVYQYTLATAFDVSNVTDVSDVSYDIAFSVNSQDGNPQGVAFSDDGMKMFIVGDDSDAVYQYTLSTAFDVSTAAYDNKSFSVASQDTSPQGLAFSGNGMKMFVVGTQNDAVYQYALSESFTLSPPPGSDASGQSEDAMVNVLPTLRYDVGYGTIARELSLVTEDRVHPTYHNAINLRQPGSDNPWIAVFPDPLTTAEGGSLVASGDPILPYDYHDLGNQVPAITCATDDFGHDPTMLAEFDYIPSATYTGTDTFDIVIKEFTYAGNAGNATCVATGATETIPVEITVGEKPAVTLRDDFTKFSNSSGVVVLERIADLTGLQPAGDGFFDFQVPFPSFDPPVSNAIVGFDLPETTDDGSAITFDEDTGDHIIRGVFSDDFFSYDTTVSLPYGTVVANGTIVESLNEIASKTIDVTLDSSNAETPTCSARVSGDLDFGILAYGDTSDAKPLAISNTGTAYVDVEVSATGWLDSDDITIMGVGQTRYSGSPNDAYADRTPVSETDATFVSNLEPSYGTSQYLQIQIGDISPNFTGQLTQTITTTATCNS